MKTSFLLGRHGETKWNVVKRLQGQLNSAMTEIGYRQAQLLAEQLMAQDIHLIATSPLPRARITAEVCHLQLGSPMIEHQGLLERHFGDWQGELFESLGDQPNFSQIFFEVTEHAPPSGESGLAASHRFEKALVELASQNQEKNILVITHGDVLRCFVSRLKETEFCDAYSQYGNGKVFKVDYDHERQRFLT